MAAAKVQECFVKELTTMHSVLYRVLLHQCDQGTTT